MSDLTAKTRGSSRLNRNSPELDASCLDLFGKRFAFSCYQNCSFENLDHRHRQGGRLVYGLLEKAIVLTIFPIRALTVKGMVEETVSVNPTGSWHLVWFPAAESSKGLTDLSMINYVLDHGIFIRPSVSKEV